MNKRHLFPVLASMVAIAVTVCGEEKSLELRLSMPRQTWAEGDDVRLNVELINRMLDTVRLNAGGVNLQFTFLGDKDPRTEIVDLFEFFGHHPLVLKGGMRVCREISLPSCPYFNSLFPWSLIRSAPRSRGADELISQTGEYAIQASLHVRLDRDKNPLPLLLPVGIPPLSYSIESEKIAWKMVSPGNIVTSDERTRRDWWHVLALQSEQNKTDHASRKEGQRTRLVYWHEKKGLGLRLPPKIVRDTGRAICYTMAHDNHKHDSGTAGDGRRRDIGQGLGEGEPRKEPDGAGALCL